MRYEYVEREVALPADLNVSERVLLFLTWGQMGYVVAGIVLGLFLSPLIPVAETQRPFVFVFGLGIGVLLAVIQPYGRGVVSWCFVLARFLSETRVFVWRMTANVDVQWGHTDIRSARNSRKPTIDYTWRTP